LSLKTIKNFRIGRRFVSLNVEIILDNDGTTVYHSMVPIQTKIRTAAAEEEDARYRCGTLAKRNG